MPTTDQTDYEVFISYARKDNRPIPDAYPQGWVTALRDFIVADHRRYSADPMRIFFDQTEIHDMDDWRNRILGALRRTKVLLICLSPNYLASKPCRWEWDEYLARQMHQAVGSEAHATVYFVEVPGSTDQENAQRLARIRGNNTTDLRPWFPVGAAAMQEEAVRGRLAALGQSVWERIQRARRALHVPGNVRAMTPYFIGRTRELADLHRIVGVGRIGLVAAVHGLGGQGKTELAIAYARSYADCYPLGLWSLDAEHQTELLPLLGSLAFKPEFGYTPTEAAKNDAVIAGQEVLVEFQRRYTAAKMQPHDAEPAALLLLDNVSIPRLLAAQQLAQLPQVDWLRMIVTTRLDPKPLDPMGKAMGTVPVDALDEASALRLIENHQPGERFRNDQDEDAARAIVRELGGFTLAIEQVAVFLAVNPDMTPADYLQRLRSETGVSTDALVDDQTADQMRHQQKRLAPVLDAMLQPLPAAARTLLAVAALLPPDTIPWPWLRLLTLHHHPELGVTKPGYPDPWLTLRRQIEGLRFLTGGIATEFARMHRLVAAHLRQFSSADVATTLRTWVAQRADALYQQQAVPDHWELDALLEAIPHLLMEGAHHQLAVDGMFLSDKVLAYRHVVAARKLLHDTGAVLRVLAESDPTNAAKQRDLSVSYNKLGDVAVASGDLPGAKNYYTQSLALRRVLAESDPTNADKQRDLAVSYAKFAGLADQTNDPAAKGWWQQCVEVFDRMLAAGIHVSPNDQRFVERVRAKLG